MAIIIDATDLIVGRFATIVAKKALLGEKIDIVNCQDAVVTGRRDTVYKHFKRKADIGVPLKGPYFPKTADRIVRRMIRGMIGWKTAKGREAFKRIMCHIGVPDKFENSKLDTIENANIKKLPNLKYVKMKDIAEHLKGSRQ
ncbi:50S ribosomal protein L13 [Candidatus Woesearchaeota archaeon]|nr:50S ribosomal protein L13 [Candidatus Woesearchaeota archaeon]